MFGRSKAKERVKYADFVGIFMVDALKAVSDSLSPWYQDGKFLKYTMVYFVLYLAMMGALFGAMFLIGQSNPALYQMFTNPSGTVDTELFFAGFMQFVVLFLIVLIPIMIVFSLVMGYVSMLMTLRGLEISGLKTAKLGLVKVLKYFVLSFWLSILAFTSWKHDKFRLIFVGLVALWIAGVAAALMAPIIGALVIVLAVIASLIYVFIIWYNVLRLYPSYMVFLHKDQGIAASADEGWSLSEGNALNIAIAFGVLIIGVIVAGFVLLIPRIIISVALAAVSAPPVIDIGISLLIDGALTATMGAISALLGVNIYVQLLKEKGSAKTRTSIK